LDPAALESCIGCHQSNPPESKKS